METNRRAIGSIGSDVLIPYGLRTVRIGLQTTLFALTALGIFAFLPGNGDIDTTPYLVVWATAALGGLVVWLLPWRRVLGSRFRVAAFAVWSALDIILLTAAIGASGGSSSSLWGFYALTTVFFVAWYPRRLQALLLAFTSVCYMGVIAIGDSPFRPGEIFIRLACGSLVAFLAGFLSRELIRLMNAHSAALAESEHRGDLVGMVANAARNMTTLGPQSVLNAVVEGALTLGLEAAEICLLDERMGTYTIVCARGLPEEYTSGTHPADRGLVGMALQDRQTVFVDDYSSMSDALPDLRDERFRSVLATPIDDPDGAVAILAGGSREDRRLTKHDVEAFELLAAQAARALATAHEYEGLQKAQEALRQSEAKYRAVMEDAADAIFLMDFDGHVLDANTAAADLTGYTRAELTTLTAREIVDTSDLAVRPLRFEEVAQGVVVEDERLIRRKDGSTVLVDLKANKLDAGRFIGVARDITMRKQTQDALETREQLLRAVSELTANFVFSMNVKPDASLEWEWVTEGFERMFGMSPEELQARGGWETIVHPDDLASARGLFAELFVSTDPVPGEFRMVRSDGGVLEARLWARTERNDRGQVIRLYGAIQDISERTRAEEELRQQKDLYESLVSAQSDLNEGVSIVDLESRRFLYVNDALCRIYGYNERELLDMPSFQDLLAPDDRERSERLIAGRVSGTRTASEVFEMVAFRKDGLPITIESLSKPLDGNRLISLIHDVTERQSAQERLRESEERYRNLYDRIPIAIYQRAWDGRGIDANPAAVELFGYPDKESLLSVPAEDFYVDPDERKQWLDVLERKGVVENFEMQLRRLDGSTFWARNAGRVVRDLDGPPLFYEGSLQDVTERKDREDALQRSNSLLRATLESTVDGILVVDGDGKILAFNQKFAEMWKLPQEVLDSHDDQQAIQVVLDQLSDPDSFERGVRRLYQSDETSLDILEFKDGRIFERFSQPQVLDGATVGRVWSFRDVTVREETARALRDSSNQLRVALGTMRRGDQERRRLLSHLVKAKEEERSRVASDIHDDSVQVMTSAAINLERLSRQARDPEQREALARLEENVRAAIGRLRKMVFELRPPALDEEGLSSALRLYLEELKLDTGIDYALVNDLSEEPPPELRVVLYRIAQEALNNARKHSSSTRVTVWLRRERDGIRLTIADNGVGMPSERMEESTPGHIGFSEMRQRAEMAGGTLDVQSQPGAGTTVDAWVPELIDARAP